MIPRALGLAACAALMIGLAAGGCATGQVITESDDGSPSSNATTGSMNGSGGAGGASAAGGNGGISGTGGDPHPCGIDCSTIETPDCQEAICNLSTETCEVVASDNGAVCDDELFCTVNDQCQEGLCVGGPPNDCGQTAPACQEISCDEAAKQCVTMPGQDGALCQDPNNLCQVNAVCQNGLCTGGTTNDCFFAPVPDECHVAVCNPATGMCEPQVGNEGGTCLDQADLCTVNKTCAAGLCQGGVPQDCSPLTQGCNVGVCDAVSGQCVGQPVGNGNACDDLDSCTVGEICGAGMCTGGTAVTQCVNGDGCCPAGCTESVDDDCGCSLNLATTATASTNGGGSGAYGPAGLNNGVGQAACEAAGCSACFSWIANNATPNGAYVQYDWPANVQIGSMYLDSNECGVNGCSSQGRGLGGGEVQYWDGTGWVTAHTIANNIGDATVTFVPKLNTTSVRVYHLTATPSCGQSTNTIIYEWYVWPGSNCMP